MKIWPLILLFVIGVILPFQSQSEAKKMAIGLQAGIHNTWPEFSSTITAVPRAYRPGVQGGVQFQYMSKKMLGFETNVLFTNIGWNEPSSIGTYFRKISAIEWQVNTHLAIGKGWLRLLVDAGPYLRFFIDESTNVTSNLPNYAELPQYSLPFQNNFQYGIFAGGGLGIRLKKIIIQGRGHFNLGLTDFFDSDIDEFLVSSDRTVGGSLSIMLPFGKAILE